MGDLFTRLKTEQNWKLPFKKEEMMTENKIYWRNKATFIVEADQKKYFVTLVSTKIYFEIHIVHTHSKEPFQLGTDGRNICRKVWNDIESVISNSLNAPLKEYTVGCQCTLPHGKEKLVHAMEFESKPHDDNEIEIKANCLLDKNRPHPVTVDTSQQSVIVWFKVSIASLVPRSIPRSQCFCVHATLKTWDGSGDLAKYSKIKF
jgi:hypothetical protein